MADFGTGIDGVSDLPIRFNTVSGFRNLGNNIARRLQTPRGSLPWAPNDGYDVRALLSEGFTDLSFIISAIEAEVEKDERVLSCSASYSFSGSRLILTLSVSTAAGPFTLVLGVDALTVEILNGVTQ